MPRTSTWYYSVQSMFEAQGIFEAGVRTDGGELKILTG